MKISSAQYCKHLTKIIIVIFAFVSLSLSAQEVINISAQQEGRDIVIYYELSDEADVDLTIRFNKKKQKVKMLSGDIGKRVQAGKQNKIVWHVLNEKGSTFLQNNVTFTIRANAPYRTILLAQGGISAIPFTPSGGLMIGGVKRVGWYVKGLSNFMFGKPKPIGKLIPNGDDMIIRTNNGDKFIPNTAMPYNVTGQYYTTHWVADAGMIVRCWHKNPMDLYLYFGAGYGERKQVVQTLHDGYLTYMPSNHSDISGDLGILFSYKKFIFSAGVTSIGYKYIDMQLGLGIVL